MKNKNDKETDFYEWNIVSTDLSEVNLMNRNWSLDCVFYYVLETKTCFPHLFIPTGESSRVL